MARPSEFSTDIANAICESLSSGNSLRATCLKKDMPAQTTVFRWLDQNEEFRKQYAHARDRQADVYADKVIEVAEDATDAALGRLKMDALKWAASKLAPRRYGDKLALSGDDDGPPIKASVTVTFV